ncbi:hypothetical protein RO3G_00545 [Rhizopus delemar RA 99-880]|uniref:Uncharacterized protein n=1 Tax=Rhizopus delemar (strain RA 99-880 / ATCC MYA-4621 / FGSC 9543 / NRRL 43880) TaxID=246409 RepID=I1BI11_RHIO9|nr:hypothetical protein RO3G_00545 [Rhizopus delemar RA 99-880]|eukprot:EIE75841.1 hypothetical protein RO3G_00545 [Rhizopus delemar RA 99-880]
MKTSRRIGSLPNDSVLDQNSTPMMFNEYDARLMQDCRRTSSDGQGTDWKNA